MSDYLNLLDLPNLGINSSNNTNTSNTPNSMNAANKIYTVRELNIAAQRILEGHFQTVLVEGEISNLAKPASGHLYFSLKDSQAQIRAAMFRNRGFNQNQTFELRNGLLVQVRAKVSIYPDRGDYQLIVESISLAGEGLLRQAYEKLLKALSEEGLFLAAHKKPFPRLPKHIGVITSPTGAAIRDILSVLKRRFAGIPITIFPTKVQGADAAPEIIRAIHLASQYASSKNSKNREYSMDSKTINTINNAEYSANNEINNKIPVDVIILARGGGSLEDLWPFNEEAVARAIFACNIPIITGIGHETDFTIADFVADQRAPTPSAAAELISPAQEEWIKQFVLYEQGLKNIIIKLIQYRAQQLDYLIKRLRHPGQQIQLHTQRFLSLKSRLFQSIQSLLKEKHHRFSSLYRTLQTLGPEATLSRGYAIVRHSLSGNIVRSISDCKEGDSLKVRVVDGEMDCQRT